jgi:hypothetical protein
MAIRMLLAHLNRGENIDADFQTRRVRFQKVIGIRAAVENSEV